MHWNQSKTFFVKQVACVYIIEFQKMSLLHIYCIFLSAKTFKIKLNDFANVDKMNCIFLPEVKHQKFCKIVVEHSTHKSCADFMPLTSSLLKEENSKRPG